MTEYYCHECAISHSLVTSASPTSLIGTQYQLDKFAKHTALSGSYQVNSVFDDASLAAYAGYVVNTSASGLLQIDSRGRKNLVWFAGSRNGAEYRNGTFVAPTDGVKLVLKQEDSKVHAFPICGSPHRIVKCQSCGRVVPLF